MNRTERIVLFGFGLVLLIGLVALITIMKMDQQQSTTTTPAPPVRMHVLANGDQYLVEFGRYKLAESISKFIEDRALLKLHVVQIIPQNGMYGYATGFLVLFEVGKN